MSAIAISVSSIILWVSLSGLSDLFVKDLRVEYRTVIYVFFAFIAVMALVTLGVEDDPDPEIPQRGVQSRQARADAARAHAQRIAARG